LGAKNSLDFVGEFLSSQTKKIEREARNRKEKGWRGLPHPGLGKGEIEEKKITLLCRQGGGPF